MTNMKSSAPRLTGLRLRLATHLLRSAAGQPFCRLLAKQLFETPLSSVDLHAAGEPPPYTPGVRKLS